MLMFDMEDKNGINSYLKMLDTVFERIIAEYVSMYQLDELKFQFWVQLIFFFFKNLTLSNVAEYKDRKRFGLCTFGHSLAAKP